MCIWSATRQTVTSRPQKRGQAQSHNLQGYGNKWPWDESLTSATRERMRWCQYRTSISELVLTNLCVGLYAMTSNALRVYAIRYSRHIVITAYWLILSSGAAYWPPSTVYLVTRYIDRSHTHSCCCCCCWWLKPMSYQRSVCVIQLPQRLTGH